MRMVRFRKPSASGLLYSPLQGNPSEGRQVRLLLTKRGIVYVGTAVVLLVLLSLIVTGVPDAKEVGSLWGSKDHDASSDPTILPLDDDVLPPIQHDDSRPPTGSTSSVTTSSTVVPIGTAYLPPSTHHFPDEKHTEDGFPLISTHNNGKLVILTGATGRGNFFEIPDFYPQVVKNRLDYVNHHGTAQTHPLLPNTELIGRVRFNDGGFSVVCDYTDDACCVGEVACYSRGV